MALTDEGKRLSQASGLWAATRYIALFTSASESDELVGHGYSREDVAAGDRSISSAGVVTVTTPYQIYEANDDSAERATHFSVYDAVSAGDLLYDIEAITNPPANAPVNGQAFNLTDLTFNP